MLTPISFTQKVVKVVIYITFILSTVFFIREVNSHLKENQIEFEGNLRDKSMEEFKNNYFYPLLKHSQRSNQENYDTAAKNAGFNNLNEMKDVLNQQIKAKYKEKRFALIDKVYLTQKLLICYSFLLLLFYTNILLKKKISKDVIESQHDVIRKIKSSEKLFKEFEGKLSNLKELKKLNQFSGLEWDSKVSSLIKEYDSKQLDENTLKLRQEKENSLQSAYEKGLITENEYKAKLNSL